MAPTRHIIYFVRHGQCTGNVTGETLKPEDDVITEIGMKQSELLGEHLKDVQFNKAFASTYSRSIDTAKGILSKMNKQPEQSLKIDSRIKEREMGILIGMTAKEVFPIMLNKLKDGEKFNEIEIPEAETTKEYEGRIHSFFKELFDDFKNSAEPQAVLVVSHGLTMRRFLSGLSDTFADLCTVTNWERKCKTIIENTACTHIAVEFPSTSEKPVLTFLKIHDTEHLGSFEGGISSGNNNVKSQGDHDINGEQKRLMIEKVMQIPGAKEELSGCVQM